MQANHNLLKRIPLAILVALIALGLAAMACTVNVSRFFATATPTRTNTPTPSDTPTPSNTPTLTNTPAPTATFTPRPTATEASGGGGAFGSCSDSSGGKDKIRITNKTGQPASLYFYGPENYACGLGPGVNIIYLKHGKYSVSGTICGTTANFGTYTINATWTFTLNCPK